jgi:hypothetical protein
MKGVLGSGANPDGLPPSKAMTAGSLAHAFFELYYDCAEGTPIEHMLDLARERMYHDHYASLKKKNFYLEHQDEIDTNALKYFSTFKRWAQVNPVPYQRERHYTKGLMEGIVDRIDQFGNRWLVTDYKTSSSVPKDPNSPLLQRYKRQVWGGYPWLLNKVFPERYNRDTLLPPHILIFRKASWKVIPPDRNWYRYVLDFDGIVHQAARILIGLAKGKKPTAIQSKQCYACIAKTVCPERQF